MQVSHSKMAENFSVLDSMAKYWIEFSLNSMTLRMIHNQTFFKPKCRQHSRLNNIYVWLSDIHVPLDVILTCRFQHSQKKKQKNSM